MRSLPERFHEQLERCRAHRSGQQQRNRPKFLVSSAQEQEIEPLVTLARSLQKARPMQVDAHFADLLEERLLKAAVQQTQYRQKTLQKRWQRGMWIAPIKLTMTRMRMLSACLCLLALFLGVGFLMLRLLPLPQQTAQAAVKVKQAELADQAAQTQLHLLTGLADPAHAQDYRQALTKLDKQIADCAEEVAEVPAGSAGNRAAQELVELKMETRQELYQVLLSLALPERVLTTTELGHLGASVPIVQSAQFALTPTKSQAVVFIQGSGIQPGAHLLIDNLEILVNGTLQNGGYTVIVPWSAQWPPPQLLGILNVDHTAAQTKAFTVKDDPDVDGKGGDDGAHGGDDGGSGGGGSDGGGSSGSGGGGRSGGGHRGPG